MSKQSAPPTSTRKLALSYLAVMMTLSLIFSGIIYFIVVSQLGRPQPPPDQQQRPNYLRSQTIEDEIQASFDERDAKTRELVLTSLVALNLIMLGCGSLVSYALARRTLRPIEHAMETQTRFISDASHELRTPLTALLTSNEVAARKKSLEPKKMRKLLDRNIVEIKKLRDLSNNLLDLTRTGDTSDLAIIDPSQLADTLAKSLSPLAKHKHSTLDVNVREHKLRVSPSSIEQILRIYIDNAIKYSPEGSQIELSGQVLKKSYKFSVADNGPGIMDAEKSKVFERFYRADSSRSRGSQAAGYGLGLAIAKNLADQHGYIVTATDAPGGGAVFFVEIPT